jgi:NAD+ kinase
MQTESLQTIAISTRPELKTDLKPFHLLVKFLEKKGKKILFDSNAAKLLKKKTTSDEVIREEADLILVFGGDGAFLGAARHFHGSEAFFAGVRYGKLGFLTEYLPSEIEKVLGKFFQGEFRVSERIALSAEVLRGKKIVKKMFALNEMVVNQNKLSRMIKLEIEMDTKPITTYNSDGVILATPTGSTAYSLSAGGPIVYPSLNAFVLTPINPHLLANRPLMIPDNREIAVIVRNANVTLTADGQKTFALKEGDKVLIRKAAQPIKVIHETNRNYFDILRAKLGWGERER